MIDALIPGGGGDNSYRMWKDSNPAATRGNVDNTLCIMFNSYEEALNCYNAMNTKLARFCCCKSVVDVHVHPEYAPCHLPCRTCQTRVWDSCRLPCLQISYRQIRSP